MFTNNKLNSAVKFALAFGAISSLAFSSYAQESQDVGAETERTERITVTGSRIGRIGEISPTPVTVITGEGLVDAGVVNVADLLHKMPNTLVGLSPETTNNTVLPAV